MNNTHDKANRRQEHADDGITQNPRRRTLLPYLMVSATQTLVEFGSFTLLHLLTVPSPTPSPSCCQRPTTSS